MVKHIILWNLKEEFNTSKIKSDMKTELEKLQGKVPGLLKMQIEYEPFATSNTDVMLYSEFESAESLKGYAIHPEHIYVADNFVRPFTAGRTVFDFEEK